MLCWEERDGEGLEGRTLQNAATPNYCRRVRGKVQAVAEIASTSTRLQLDSISQLTWVCICESGAAWWICKARKKTLSAQSSWRKVYDKMSLQHQDTESHVVQF